MASVIPHREQDDALTSPVPVPSSHSGSSPPAAKKVKCSPSEDFAIKTRNMRLPTPCPLPTLFTEDVEQAIAANNIKGIMKLRLERQAAAYYYGICPRPKPSEYSDMAKAMCDKFHQLKSSKHKEY